MKFGKKLLSVLLCLAMIVGTVSVSFSVITVSAINADELKAAFQNATDTDLSSGDGTMLAAAEALYNYVCGIATTSCNGITGSGYGVNLAPVANNSSVDLNRAAKSALGDEYNAVVDALIPTAGVCDDSTVHLNQNKTYTAEYPKQDFHTTKLQYGYNNDANHSVTVSANLEKILLNCASLADVEETILLSATYSYYNSVRRDNRRDREDQKKWGVVYKSIWHWSSASWHTLSQMPVRSDVRTDTDAYVNLHAFADYFTDDRLSVSLDDLCRLSAAEINAIIADNNTYFGKLDSYSINVKKHFFNIDKTQEYMNNCLFAQKVINALPSVDSMQKAIKSGYNNNDFSSMNSIYTAQKPNLEYLRTVDNSVFEYITENLSDYADFSIEKAEQFIAKLDKDIQLYKLREIKAAVDALRTQYPDADSIKGIEDNQLLWNYYDLIKGYNKAIAENFTPAYVYEVFTDGTDYVSEFESQLKYEWDYREAQYQYDSYWEWFLPLVYADLTKIETSQIISNGIAENIPNVPNAVSKKSSFDKMYEKYTALIGSDSMQIIFGSGENSLGFIIDDYIARLYATILARLTQEVSTAVGYFDAYGEVNMSNFTAIKEAIGRVETDIWNFINSNNPSIISQQLRDDYNRLSSLLDKFNAFVASGGLANFEQKHLHNENGVFMTRTPMDNDIARKFDENYDVTEEIVNNTIEKLDKYLTSPDFTGLANIGGGTLSEYIKEVLAENLYTDEFVNMVVGTLYPALVSSLEDLYYNDLPRKYTIDIEIGRKTVDLSYKSLRNIITDLGLALYPNQMAGYIDGYPEVRNKLASASTWDALTVDGDIVLDWGIDSIKPENYSTTEEFINAKKAKFLGAMAESFDAILPVVRILFTDWDSFKAECDRAARAVADFGILGDVSVSGDITLTADGCAGYSDLVVPVLEALGCSDIPDYSTVRGYTTSSQIVNAIFNPLIDFVENKLAESPVSTLCSVLPNLAYAVSMDKIWPLMNNINIRLNYKLEDNHFGIKLYDDGYDLRLRDMVNKDKLDLDFDISSFSSIVSYLVSMFIDNFDSSDLPLMNAGSLVTYASLETNAPTKRLHGSRINFKADTADVFMAVLDYLTRCLGNSDFVDIIWNQFSDGEEMDGELKKIIESLYTSTSDEKGNMALAALIELLNQTEYALEEYKWYDETSGGTVEGITPASFVYLSYSNDWTKQAADYVAENLSEIVESVLKTSGSDININAEVEKGINSLFTNNNLTKIAKGMSSLGSMSKKLLGVIKEQLGVDLSVYKAYKKLTDDYSWGFADGDRNAFTDALLNVLSPLEPLYGFLFKGEQVHLFEKSADVVLYGNEGYDNAIVPLLEALGCDVKDESEFSAEDTIKVVLETLYAKIDKIIADPINEITDILPGVLYYLSSGALSTSVRNLLHPIYVILDTIRPIYDLDFSQMLEINGRSIDLEKLDASFAVMLIEEYTGLKLDKLETLINDISKVVRTPYTSKSNFAGKAFKGEYSDGSFDKSDMLTVIISYLLETLKDDTNAQIFDNLIGTENFTGALLSIFKGTDPEKKTINWMYYFGEEPDLTDFDFTYGVVIEPTGSALEYPNNWTENTAAYINANLDDVADKIVAAAGEEGTLSQLLKSKLNIYTPETLNKINSSLVDLLKKVDAELISAANVILGLDLDKVASYTAPESISGGEEFADELIKIVSPIEGLIKWLLFGKDYKFFTGTDKDQNGDYIYNDLITVKGAQGYKNGIIPILEALGCKNIPDADDANALGNAIKAVVSRLDEILEDPVNEILEILPNIIYFLNADGLTASVYNTISAVWALIASLEKLGVNVDVNKMLGFDLNNLSLEQIIALVEEETGLDLIAVKKTFCGLCIGTITQYLSQSGEYAYKMSYTEESDRKDMLTLILTVLAQTVKLDGNEEKLRQLFGNDVYDAVLGVMNLRQFDMEKPGYLYTEYADTDKTFSAVESSELYKDFTYGPLYTKEMSKYIADHIDTFIDNIIYLLGIEINGIYVDSLEDVLNAVVNGSLYNSKNIQAILNKLLELSAKVDAIDGSKHIKAVIKTSLGVDLDAWKSYTVPTFENDREQFTKALCDVLEPFYPVLKWMLCNKDISFFVDEEGKDLVTLLGAQGYAYGIIPILEALGCENVLTPEKYYEAVEADSNALITCIVNPLFDRVDDIMTNPAQKILEILPQVIYFVNSNGLDACFKNALHSVYGILNAIEPLVKVDLYELINFRLDEVTFESLYKLALEKIEEKTGQKLSALEGNALIELTVGKLVSYTSANGEKAYKMVYQSKTAKAEMVTVIERLVISFIMQEDNRVKLLTILKEQCGMSDDAEKYVSAFLDLLATYTTTTHHGMDQALFAVYQIFYGAEKGTSYAANGLKALNAKWKEIIRKLNGSNDPNAKGLGTFIADILDSALDGIFDSNGLASKGFIVFWQKIIELFKKIIAIFKVGVK